MSEDLREAMLGQISAFHANIATLTTAADELVRSANLLDGRPTAVLMRDLARRQRVKVLEMQGQLAALKQAYTERFHREA